MRAALSTASLGGIVLTGENTYKKNGIRITRLVGQRLDRNTRYPVCILNPSQGWFPSKTANFVFRDVSFDPHYIVQMASEDDWNPSIWLHAKSNRYVLRVPKDCGEKVRTRLYRRGLWYNPATNLWHCRRRRSKKQGYPSFVQSLELQAKGEKKCRSKEEAPKKLFLKISRRK